MSNQELFELLQKLRDILAAELYEPDPDVSKAYELSEQALEELRVRTKN